MTSLLRFAAIVLFALPLYAQPDIAVDVAPSSTSVVRGDAMQVTVHVSNLGTAAAHSLTIGFRAWSGALITGSSAPGWSCGVAAQENGVCTRAEDAGAYPDIVLDVQAPSSTTLTSFDVTAVISSDNNDDTNHANDSDAATIALLPPFTFDVQTVIDPDPVYTGDAFTATFTMTNNGPQTSGNLQLQVGADPVPIFVGATGSGWTCSHGDVYVICQHAPVAVNVTTSVVVTSHAPATGGTYAMNSVLFANSGESFDDPVTYEVIDHAELSTAIYGPTAAASNASVQHDVSITNGGVTAATNVSVALEATTSILDASGDGWTCESGTCTRPAIQPATVAPPILVTTATGAAGTMTLTATVSAMQADLFADDNSASIPVEVGGFMLASASPISGSVAGGTTLAVTGDGFLPGAVVSVDGVAVQTTFVSATTLKATTRPHGVGTVNLSVVNPGGTTAMLMSAFRFEPAGGGRRRTTRH